MIIDDKTIIQAIRGRTEVGFKLLMQKYKQPIYWHIRRLVVSHDDAQDATQEAFIRIFRSFNQLKDEKSFQGWLFRIATNEAFRLIESSNLEVVRLQRAILTLPIKQQVTFNLRYYNELNYDDIAEATGSTPSSAKVNYHIAKEKIIKYINSNENNYE